MSLPLSYLTNNFPFPHPLKGPFEQDDRGKHVRPLPYLLKLSTLGKQGSLFLAV